MEFGNHYRLLKIYGVYFIICAFACALLHIAALSKPYYTIEFQLFVLLMGLLHFFVGIGIFYKKKWGYYLFKLYLYLLYLAIPIGTYISLKTLKYIEKYNIRKYFKL